jgi:hypothetical protein
MNSALEWFKSSYSGSDGGQCLEVATCPTAVHVRDSKDPAAGTLTLTPAAWAALAGFAAGSLRAEPRTRS